MIKEKDFLSENPGSYWTPLEKRWRDWFFRPLTQIFGLIPYAANILTILGFIILLGAVIDFVYLNNHIKRQVWFLVIAWLTDLLDGPTARNNKNITAFGTAADHTRDFLLIMWTIFLSVYVTHSIDKTAAFIIYAILGATVAGMLLIAFRVWLYGRKKRREKPNQSYFVFVNEFLLNDLVTTVGARLHTVLTALGIIFYLAGAIWQNAAYLYAGVILLVLQLISLGFYLYEVFQAEYEDRACKIRAALQKKIIELEETFNYRKNSKNL